MEEQNSRLTTGSSPVYHRFITETRSALSSWLLTSGPTLFCPCKLFFMQGMCGKRRESEEGEVKKGYTARREELRSESVKKGGKERYFPGHALHEKGLQRQKRRRFTGQQSGTKSAFRLAVKALINRGSTAHFVPPFVYIGFSLVRPSGKTLKQRSCNPLEDTRDLCFLGEQFCWHPILPDPGRFRRAPRPDPPVVCPGFGFDRLRKEWKIVLFGVRNEAGCVGG